MSTELSANNQIISPTKVIITVLSDFKPSGEANLELNFMARVAVQFWVQSRSKQVSRIQTESFCNVGSVCACAEGSFPIS